MQRQIVTALMMLALLGTSACSSMESGKSANLKSFQISAVHWDEVAAADTAAHVSNNNLIMMR